METPYSLPELCRETGLSCESCTENTARNLARMCQGVQGKTLGQLFVQLYPHKACSPMHGHFATTYRQATTEAAVM